MNPRNVLSKTHFDLSQLVKWADQGCLYGLVDAHFGPWRRDHFLRLNAKDTDPELFDLISWPDVVYKPPVFMKIFSEDLNYIQNNLMTDRFGLFFVSHKSLFELTQHFQKFVIAKGPDGDPYFFKFQDAAVLEVFLETWGQAEISTFLGPAEQVGMVDLDHLDFVFYAPQKHLPESKTPESCLLQLRADQLEMCQARIEKDLVKIIGWHLRSEHAPLVGDISKETLESRVLFGIRKARRYHLETVSDLAGFVGLLFEIAPNFDQHPKIRELLLSRKIPGERKLDVLIKDVSEQEWREAALLYDAGHWPKMSRKAS